MRKTGVLVHVRHPETIDWDRLVWGVPSEDHMGDLPKLVEVLLLRAVDHPVTIVMGTTSATKDGLLEGEYTKKYLLDRIDRLAEFPRLKERLAALSDEAFARLRANIESITVTRIIKNTAEEITEAARIFNERDVQEVIQITAASHGPRCVQAQAVARESGVISRDQLWSVVITDMSFAGSTPLTTLILEPPHRGDDPMLAYKPTLPEVLRPYIYNLTPEDKKKLIQSIDKFMDEHVAK